MRQDQYGYFAQHLSAVFEVGAIGDSSDGHLLERFKAGGGDAAELAFALLVERHGAMVMNTCRSVLRNAEDARRFSSHVHRADASSTLPSGTRHRRSVAAPGGYPSRLVPPISRGSTTAPRTRGGRVGQVVRPGRSLRRPRGGDSARARPSAGAISAQRSYSAAWRA